MGTPKLVRYHNVVLPSEVKNSFSLLQEDIYLNLGIAIEPVDGFKSKPEILYELALRVKYLDTTRLSESYITNLDPLEFEPPLTGNKFAKRDNTEQIYTIPNKPNVDPRLTGRIVQIGPKNIINPTTLYYMVYNAGNYGFVHYGPTDPSVWYWRGDKEPKIYTPLEVVSTFSDELRYLL